MNAVPSSLMCTQNSLIGDTPFIDYVSISRKTKGFDSSGLTKKNEYKYQLQKDFTHLDIFYSGYYQTLTLNGSLPWFTQGHNLSFSKVEFRNAIQDLSIILDVDMEGAGIKTFELAKVIPVDYPVHEYQINHFDLKGFERIHKQNTLYYNQYTRRGKKSLTIKMYNAVANAVAKQMTFQPKDNHLKFEMKIHNPAGYFKQGISVSEMINDMQIINKTYSEMKHHYKNIEKAKDIKLPESPTSDELILAGLVSSSKQPMAVIERLINSSALDTQGRSKRRRLIRKKLEQMTVEDSKYQLQL